MVADIKYRITRCNASLGGCLGEGLLPSLASYLARTMYFSIVTSRGGPVDAGIVVRPSESIS